MTDQEPLKPEYLIEIIRELCLSSECYCALNTPEDQWCEYEYFIYPAWREASGVVAKYDAMKELKNESRRGNS